MIRELLSKDKVMEALASHWYNSTGEYILPSEMRIDRKGSLVSEKEFNTLEPNKEN